MLVWILKGTDMLKYMPKWRRADVKRSGRTADM
jgi:hypothetical protein